MMRIVRSGGCGALGLASLLSLALSCLTTGCSPNGEASSASATSGASAGGTPDPVAPRKFNFVPRERKARSAAQTIEFPRFTDVASACGINHTYDNGASPRALMVESTGGGCGWFDFDLDGQLDLFLTQGGIPDIEPGELRPPDACYRQVASGQFVDVAELAGLGDREYGQGVTIGDVDNDGFDDLFVANVGRCSLYLNHGDGTFLQAIDRLTGKRDVWTSSGAWGDIDRDGDLDLYVCNYTHYDPYHPTPCLDKSGSPAICHPRHVQPEPDEFFLNQGDGTFVEASQALGLFGPLNKALGVVIADLTGDEWPDIFVANDTAPNFLFVSENGSHFRESGMIIGGALSATGESQANMGVAFGDYDRNGWPDLCISHFTGEGYTLYQNLGPQGLQDVTALTGLRELTLPRLGFGAVMHDFNRDGRMDMVFANGHIDPKFGNLEGYEMTQSLVSFDGTRWRDGAPQGGKFFTRQGVGRGLASADYDRDGDLDLVLVFQNSPTALLRNDSPPRHGLQVQLVGRESNRSGYGARVTIKFGDQQLKSELAGGTSFAASHERLLSFGLGDWSGPLQIDVTWPSGITDRVELPAPDEPIIVDEGHGRRATNDLARQGEAH